MMANGSGGGKIEGNKEMSRTENPRFGSNREFSFPKEKATGRNGSESKQNKAKRRKNNFPKQNETETGFSREG